MEKSLTLPFESSAYFGYPYFPGQFGPYLYIPPVEPKAYEQIFVFQPTMPFF